MSEVVDELASTLFALDIGGLGTAAATATITTAITAWAHRHGWLARTEARVGIGNYGAVHARIGFVDVVVRRDDAPDLAIEIDSTHKPWSVEKLRHAVSAGMHGIWVRWGDDVWAGQHDDIDVIQLSDLRRPVAQGDPAQLALWARGSGVGRD